MFFNVSIRARQLNEWWVSTVEVVDDIGFTEGHTEGQDGLEEPIREAIDIRTQGQTDADSPGHFQTVMQGVAYGHIAVIGHGCQYVKLCEEKSNEKVALNKAANEGNCLLV